PGPRQAPKRPVLGFARRSVGARSPVRTRRSGSAGPEREALVIPMTLVGVRVEVPNNQPIVLLREDDGQRYLPIYIGSPEATAIVYALQGMETPRPMTHDLFTTVLGEIGARLSQVVITDMRDGTFFAEIEIARPDGTTRISSRPSDAIALAVRSDTPVPIYAQ